MNEKYDISVERSFNEKFKYMTNSLNKSSHNPLDVSAGS
jgi:hypothetical protein